MPKLTKRLLLSYSGITLPLAAMGMPLSVYLPPFYAEQLGVSLMTVGVIFTAARMWDMITDPVMGLVIDRFSTRWGRRKHWIVIAIPLILLSIWQLFMPNKEDVNTLYVGFWLFLLYAGYTMVAITHQTWGAELTTTYDQRSQLFGWREVFTIGGILLVLTAPTALDLLGSAGIGEKVAVMGWFCLITFPILLIPMLLFVPDSRGTSTASSDSGIAYREMLLTLSRNTLVWRLLSSEFASSFGTTVVASLIIFLTSYVFELPEQASVALLLYFTASFVAMPLWLQLAYRFGKDKTMKFALLYAIFMQIGLIAVAEPGNAPLLWAYTLLYGAAFGAAPTILRSMMADVTDEDELKNGKNRAGLLFAILTTSGKLGSAIAVGVSYTVLEQFFGFQPGNENSTSALNGLLLTYSLCSALGFALAWLPLFRYPLGRIEHNEIRRKLSHQMQS